MEEKVAVVSLPLNDVWISIAPPIPTTPFRAELLTAMRIVADLYSSSVACREGGREGEWEWGSGCEEASKW